jgi:cytochrome c biogenesis protein
MATTRAVAVPLPAGERLARRAERLLRWAGDARVGLVLLLLTGLANAGAALLPDGPRALGAWPYLVLLGALALSGVAAVAVRAPATWREWRRPGTVIAGHGALTADVAAREPAQVEDALTVLGYRVRREAGRRGRWAVHGVRRGPSRFAGQSTHLAVVLIVLGAAIGAAFGSETTFSLFAGDQALLDTPRPGFSAAVRLEAFDATFGPDGRPSKLDTRVTFLRDGQPVLADATLRVNEPGSFDGYLVHPWTYGPAVRLRVTTLGGSALLDAPVALDQVRDGVPVGAAELPTAGVSLGLALADAARNQLGVSVVGTDGLVDTARIGPGESARLGSVIVELERFDAWVTFLSRRDPGLLVLFAGAALLSAALAVAFWLPRRRVTVRPVPGGLRVVLRGERFDRPARDLDRLVLALGGAR